MKTSKITLIFLVLALCITLLAGCAGKTTGNSATTASSTTSSVSSALPGVEYDAASIIDGSRDTATVAKYPLSIYDAVSVQVTTPDKNDSNGVSSATGNKPTNTSDAIVPPSASVSTPSPTKASTFDSFLAATNTDKTDYTRCVVAFFPDQGYFVGMIKPADGKDGTVEKALNTYIDSKKSDTNTDIAKNFGASILNKHNGYYIVVVSTDATSLSATLMKQIDTVDNLLNQAMATAPASSAPSAKAPLTTETASATH